MKKVKCLLLGLLLSSSFSSLASDGKLLATPGVSQIEGR